MQVRVGDVCENSEGSTTAGGQCDTTANGDVMVGGYEIPPPGGSSNTCSGEENCGTGNIQPQSGDTGDGELASE